jgi:hypothetical protein
MPQASPIHPLAPVQRKDFAWVDQWCGGPGRLKNLCVSCPVDEDAPSNVSDGPEEYPPSRINEIGVPREQRFHQTPNLLHRGHCRGFTSVMMILWTSR